MKLMTKELEKKLPSLGETDGEKNPIIQVKYFDPTGSWTWYGIEYDKEQRLFFGAVQGFEFELGYFSLDELESVTTPFGLGIERDLHFKPTSLKEIEKLYQ